MFSRIERGIVYMQSSFEKNPNNLFFLSTTKS